MEEETYPIPPEGWTCFHCGENFKTIGGARDHFGEHPEDVPGCMIKVQLGQERGLQMALRKAESRARRLESRVRNLEGRLEYAEGTLAGRCLQFGGAEDMHQAYMNYDSLEGRAITAEAIVTDIEARMPAMVEASRRRVTDGPRKVQQGGVL